MNWWLGCQGTLKLWLNDSLHWLTYSQVVLVDKSLFSDSFCSVDAIVKLSLTDPLTDWPTDRGRCLGMLSHLKIEAWSGELKKLISWVSKSYFFNHLLPTSPTSHHQHKFLCKLRQIYFKTPTNAFQNLNKYGSRQKNIF